MDRSLFTGNYLKYITKNPLKKILIYRFTKKIICILEKLDHENIIDIGCGEGFITNEIFNRFSGCEIVGVDFNENSLSIANKLNSKIKFIKGDIYSLPFDDDSFDTVVCTEVLEHLSQPEKALDELRRISRSNIIISVPNEPFFILGNLFSLSHIKTLGNPPDHVNHWTYFKFKKWVEKHYKKVRLTSSFPWTVAYCKKV